LVLGVPLLAAALFWYPADSQIPGAPARPADNAPAHAPPAAGVLGPSSRAGWRKASPVTRGQDLGFRFRPDERAGTYGEVIVPGGGQAEPREQANFRPVEPRRKPTYEELQAREQAAEPVPRMPPASYPALPPALPPPYPVAPW
jgi:hypothetical protein